MKKTILLFLLVAASMQAQPFNVPHYHRTTTPAPSVFVPSDSTFLWAVAADVADSLGKSPGDTLYYWPNRMRWRKAVAMGHLYQTTASAKPVLRDSVYGKSIVFDGVNDQIGTPIGKFSQPNTWYIAFKAHRIYDRTLIGSGDGTAWNQLYTKPAEPPVYWMYAGAEANTGIASRIDSVTVAVLVYNGASTTATINGITASGSVGSVGTQGTVGVSIGAWYTRTQPSSLGVLEIIGVHNADDATERARVSAYLYGKYK